MSDVSRKQRVLWIDVARGAAMILVFFGHIGAYWFPALGTSIKVVFLFHMPLFFALSGIFFNPKLDFMTLVKRRARQLLIPYYVFSVLMLGKAVGHIFFAGIYRGKADSSSNGSALEQVVAIMFNTSNGLWFFWSLFLATLLLWGIVHIFKGNLKLVICSALVLLLLDAVIRHYVTVALPFTLNRLLSSTGYLALGYAYKKTLLRLQKREAAIGLVIAVPVFAILAWTSLVLAPRFGLVAVWLFSILASLAGIVMIIVLCRVLPDISAIRTIGRYSLVFYAFNDITLKACKLIAFKLFPQPMLLPVGSQTILALTIVLVAIGVVYAILPFVREYLWWAIGLSRPVHPVARHMSKS